MDQTLFALPILLGKIEAARAFLTEIEGERKRQYATSEGRLFAGENIGRAFQTFATSQDEFDRWFKERGKGDDVCGPEHAAIRADERDPLRLPGMRSRCRDNSNAKIPVRADSVLEIMRPVPAFSASVDAGIRMNRRVPAHLTASCSPR